MQDGAPAHIALLSLTRVPPNSLDLTPIEMLWGIVKARVAKLRPETRDGLAYLIQEVWSSLDQQMIDRLVGHV
jgi:transposase